MQDIFIGVDVSKDTLDIAGSPGGPQLVIANRRSEIKQWLKGLPRDARIAMESTGCYHQLLAELAQNAQMRVYVLNPKRVWHAARGDGRRSKTDRVDAQVIAKFLRDHVSDLHEWCPGTAVQRDIEELERRRHCIEKHCTAMHASLKGVKGLDAEIERFEREIKAVRDAIELRIDLLAELDQNLAKQSALLKSVPAIGPVTSTSLATLFERVPFKTSDSVVAFIGIDVRASDSGLHRGKRRLTKLGPAYLRKHVWLIGFAGSHTKLYKPIYEALMARGLKYTEAVMILGRRILRIAWAVWRTGVPFDPQKVGQRACLKT
jgi:transposase